ncbi:MAG: aminoglycoside phosphotransferase family protein [Lachnospiraceae bacterium]|nr:aminoglycoside phosphotransferase family protein [Lachnospiraceae bacterium]
MYDVLLEKICRQLELGTLTAPPGPLSGGYLHKMYSLFTWKGRYAVKLLNPHIMRRETALENYRRAERLERILEENQIPIVPALDFGGKKMQETCGQFFYLYQWYEGRALRPEEIRVFHCTQMGGLLARIHGLDTGEEAGAMQDNTADAAWEVLTDWDHYMELLSGKNKELCLLMKENLSLLYEVQEKGNQAARKLLPVRAICHNDLDSKNVLWKGMDCRIIDLECLDYGNPFLELYDTALYWSGIELCHIDYCMLGAFVRAYAEAGGRLPEDWEVLYHNSRGRLEWLEYNVRRALGMECSEEEVEIGISQVRHTMAQMVYYHDAKGEILNCLRQVRMPGLHS